MRRLVGAVMGEVQTAVVATDPNICCGVDRDMPDKPAGPDPDPDFGADGVPTFDSVREKIETRYETSLGAAELDAETPQGRSVEEQYQARQRAAAERLEQIRASMHRDAEEQDDH
jgi:hypothetical protein